MTRKASLWDAERREALNSLGNIANGMMTENTALDPEALFAIGDQMASHLETLGWDSSPPWKPTGSHTPDLPLGMQP